MPGKKDVLTGRNVDKSKVKMRKRLLLDDISNLHLKFNAEYPNHLIGKSKFFDLRPLWVIPIRDQSQEVCKCIYHENINLLCTLLRNFARSMKLDLDYKILASKVHYWSDGPSSQFKNQFNFTNLKFHEKDYQCMADWSFFATSHGKGENDGLGGDVKNAVWRQTMQLKVVVNNLFDFVDVAQKTFPHFKIVAFLSAEVRKDSEFLQNRYSERSRTLPGTQKFHFISIKDGKVVGNFTSPSCSCHGTTTTIKETDSNHQPSITPVVGKFYNVKYTFQCEKGGNTTQVLPAMCNKKDLEEHLFTFLKRVSSLKDTYCYKLDEQEQG